jgi:hypothetical protein
MSGDHQPPDEPARATGDGAPKPPLAERIRARFEELGVDGQVSELVGRAEEALSRGAARAGELTHQHREQIDGVLDRAGGRLDLRTEGRYADRINRARHRLDRGVDRIEERRFEPPADPGTDPE